MEGGPKRRMTTEVHQTYPGRARAKGTITPTRVNRPHTPRPCRRGQHAPHHQACEAVQAGLDSPRALRTNAKALEHTAGTTVALRQLSKAPDVRARRALSGNWHLFCLSPSRQPSKRPGALPTVQRSHTARSLSALQRSSPGRAICGPRVRLRSGGFGGRTWAAVGTAGCRGGLVVMKDLVAGVLLRGSRVATTPRQPTITHKHLVGRCIARTGQGGRGTGETRWHGGHACT